MTTKFLPRSFILIIVASLYFFQISGHADAASPKKNVVTIIELQSMLMGYADRFNNTLFDAYLQFGEANPSPAARAYVLNDMVYTQASMFTLAAEPNPEKSLLDMVAVTTLGRLIYQNTLRQKYGAPIEKMAAAYKQLESDIWGIANTILTNQQQQELHNLILAWRRNHPNKVKFNLVRFNNFAVDRNKSTLVENKKARGLFKSVDKATKEIEEVRMVTERSLYLGTRLPLLIGNFSEAWINDLMVNPELSKILNNIETFSDVSERLASVAESLPADFAKERKVAINQVMKEVDTLSQKTLDQVMSRVALERKDAIDQFMDRIAAERKSGLEEIIAEEQRIKDMVIELRKMFTEGNNLLVSANTLTHNLNLDEPTDQPADTKPFDIREYRDTIIEVTASAREFSVLVDKMEGLVSSKGWEQLMPQIVESITRVENEGEKFINHAFQMAIVLILIWLAGYFVVRVMLMRYAKK